MVLHTSSSLQAQAPAPLFEQPGNCLLTKCSAIAMYEEELERHRETEAELRQALLREDDLLRQKDELIQQKDQLIQQKDILGKESEHRLLNGLQLVTSMLSAQSREIDSPEVAAQLTVAANRVATLARVNRHLRTLDKLESVEFRPYLEKLCHDLSDMASVQLSLCVEGAELKIPSVIAVPLGLITSELVTNSIKYAKGKISVALKTGPNGDYVLSVSDDGQGLPAAFDPAAASGMGMKIIAALVRQIRGELHFTKGDRDQGTRFSVTFTPQF